MFAAHPILLIIHSTCPILPSNGTKSPFPNKGLGLFFRIAASPVGEKGLPLQLPNRAGKSEEFLFSREVASSDKEGIFGVSKGSSPLQSFDTLIANSESSSLAASSPEVAAAWSFRALQAFSRIDCRYLLWASIRSWRRCWTWFQVMAKAVRREF